MNAEKNGNFLNLTLMKLSFSIHHSFIFNFRRCFRDFFVSASKFVSIPFLSSCTQFLTNKFEKFLKGVASCFGADIDFLKGLI